MAFTVLSWNVEHFRGTPARLRTVAEHIRGQEPDVFAVLEVKNVDLPTLMVQHFPAYDFAITKGRQAQEILVGWRRGFFEQTAFLQKREFRLYNPYLRPGAQLVVRHGGQPYYLLFLHTDSGTEARDFGNRYEMFEKVWKLNAAVRRAEGDDHRLLVMGDLNTMGLFYPHRRVAHELVPEADEIAALHTFARARGMRVLHKSHGATYRSARYGESDLDHVLVSDGVSCTALGSRDDEPYHVAVEGWQQLQGAARRSFLNNISDHCSLRVEVA